MAYLTIKIYPTVSINFINIDLYLIRSILNTPQNTSINYTLGSGQTITQNEILFTEGVEGNEGFFQIKSLENKTISGSGSLNVEIKSIPLNNATNGTKIITLFGGSLTFNMHYNSLPTIDDIVVELNSAEIKTFALSDFLPNYDDYDNDDLSQIAIFGDVTGYQLYEVDYIAGTYINTSELAYLTYTAPTTEVYIEKQNTIKVKDINGNISL